MRSRGLVVAIAVVLAVLAAAGVIVYTSNLEESITEENTVSVFVSSQDIASNTDLDPLIAQGIFTPISVPIDAQVATAVTSLDQLAGQTSAAPIYANEQIPISRLSEGGGGNQLGITPGNVALGLSIAGPQSVNGAITQGSHVVVYATFTKGTAVYESTLEKLLTGSQIQKFYEAVSGTTTTGLAQAPVLVMPVDFTVSLVPTVEVLAVQNPPVDPSTGRKTDGATTMALDLTPEDASSLVFSISKAEIYLGLLPPENEDGYETPGTFGVPIGKVLGVAPVTDASVVCVGTPQSFRQQVARALEVESDDVGWVQSATAAEELLMNAYSPIDVLVLSPEVKEPDALGLAEFVGRTSPGTAIVLVRDHTWNGLLPAAMRAGIRDVVDMTQGSDELREAVERAIIWASNLRSAVKSDLRSDGSKQVRGHIVSVFSSKGGSGKTFLTTNLATAIADVTGQDTAVVDLDVDMGDVFTYFGREPTATIHDLMSLGEGATSEEIRSVAVEVAPHTWAFGAPPDPAAEAPAGEAIGKFLRGIRNEFTYVVVDASVDYSDSALVCFDLSDMICLVTALDVVGVKHLAKALDTLLTIGLPRERFRVVLNRADSKVGLDASDVERVMKISVDAMIPSSRLVPTSLNKGRPVVLDEPGSEVAQSIHQLAVRFVGGVGSEHPEDSLVAIGAGGSAGVGKKKRGGLFAKKS